MTPEVEALVAKAKEEQRAGEARKAQASLDNRPPAKLPARAAVVLFVFNLYDIRR